MLLSWVLLALNIAAAQEQSEQDLLLETRWYEEFRAGQLDVAMATLEELQALRAVYPGPDHPWMAQVLNNMGVVWLSREDWEQARGVLERSLAIELGAGTNPSELGANYNNLAMVYMSLGDLETAESFAQRAVELARPRKDEDLWSSLSMLASVYSNTGRREQAIALQRESLALREALHGPDDPRVAIGLNNLAVSLPDRQEALVLLARAEAISTALGPEGARARAAVFASLADVHYALSNAGESVRYAGLALDAAEIWFGERHPETARRWVTLGNTAVDEGDFDEARAAYARALDIWNGQLDLLGGLSEAEAFRFIDIARQAYLHHALAETSIGDGLGAWTEARRYKGIIARMLTARRRDAGLDHPSTERLRQTRRQLASLVFHTPEPDPELQARIAAVTAEKEQLERDMRTADRGWQSTAEDGALCAALGPGEVLVDLHFLGDDSAHDYVAWVMVEHGSGCLMQMVHLGDGAPIDAELHAWRSALTQGSELADRHGQRVRESVWTPLTDLLVGAHTVWISPDGALGSLPWAALPLEDGRVVLEAHQIRLLGHPDQLLSAPRPLGKRMLALGEVDFGELGPAPSAACRHVRWPALPGTSVELDTLQRAWRRLGPVRQLTGTDASVEGLRATWDQADVVHVASHGFFASEVCTAQVAEQVGGRSPLLKSGLVLAGANQGGGTGILSAEAIAAERLPELDLVVMSACETGLGTVSTGEGMLGLQRAFASAGVQNLVMSLWAVPDGPTAALMGRFYRGLGQGEPPAEALRLAQLHLLRAQRRSGDVRPRDWGAWVISGR